MSFSVVTFGRCAACGAQAVYLDVNDGTCLDGVSCSARQLGRRPTERPPAAPVPPPTCDCGAAAADPVSTRRDGGPGHAGWCSVGGGRA